MSGPLRSEFAILEEELLRQVNLNTRPINIGLTRQVILTIPV